MALFVLGGGSNLLVSDAGFDGLVLRVALRGIDVAEDSGQACRMAQRSIARPPARIGTASWSAR